MEFFQQPTVFPLLSDPCCLTPAPGSWCHHATCRTLPPVVQGEAATLSSEKTFF